MGQQLRWGLLSTARINSVLIPAIRGSRRHQLAAVASRSPEQAGAFARKWNIPRALASYEALLSDPEIDVIYIPLPNHLHAEWAVKAMRAGKHVLCEKPLALSAKQADEMTAASHETGRVLAEAFMYRHHPQTLKARELVDSGALGQIITVRGAFSFPLDHEEDIRWDKEKGGGSLWDVGCYPVNYIRYLVGSEPLEVFGWQALEKRGCDETFIGNMRFPGGILAQFDSSFRCPPRTELEVVGSRGTLNIPVPFKPGRLGKLELTLAGKRKTIQVRGQELYSGEVEDMADAILLGRTPHISLEDSRGNALVIESLLESARSGLPVKI